MVYRMQYHVLCIEESYGGREDEVIYGFERLERGS